MTWSPALILLALVLTACSHPSVETTTGALAGGPTRAPGTRAGSGDLILATTTSTQDSGLLDVLVPLFERETGYRVKTISVGTGAALALGARGDADVVLVHARDAEKRWMAEGNGTERLLVMHNDFLIVGPALDPAGIRGERSAVAALSKITATQAPWLSRDDNSGTAQREKQLWQDAGLTPKGQPWHLISGQGMSATLTLADHKNAYTLSDRSTYLARRGTLALAALVEGDPRFLNFYHVMPLNPAKFPGVALNAAGAKTFAEFLISPPVQRVIGDFGRDAYGQPLFVPAAGKTEDQVSW